MAVFRNTIKRIADPAFSDELAGLVLERLRDVKRDAFETVLWIGGGDAAQLQGIKTFSTLEQRPFPVEGAIEHFPYPENHFDLIAVIGTLHTVNDLPGVLVQMRRALKPDGLFIGALTGGETLFELRDSQMRVESTLKQRGVSRVHPMIDLQTLAGLMQRAGFALPVADAERKEVYYYKLRTLLTDIRDAGEGMKLADAPPYAGKNFWDAVEADYKAHHVDKDGLMRMTIEIIHAIGWGPADTQQRPLKPGSAQARMADALGAVETRLPR